MTETDLESALGPPRNQCRNAVTVWAPKADGTIISAEIAPGTPDVQFFSNAGTRDQGREIVWLSETGLIAPLLKKRPFTRQVLPPYTILTPSAMDWLDAPELSRLLSNLTI
jgi:hypothetical protein